MQGGLVTVFGGSGFLGRHVVRALCRKGWRVRVAMRRPHLGGDLRLAGDVGQVQLVQANVRNRPSIDRALDDADAVVDLVGVLVERGRQSFNGENALGARNIAELTARAGISKLVYVSAIGAQASSRSRYFRSKGEGERSVREAVPTATILRPALLFGQGDGFLTMLAEMTRLTPVLPVIGAATKVAPVYVADVADAVAAALARPEAAGKTYELAGPRTYTIDDLYKFVTREVDRPRLLLPLPFAIAAPMGYIVGALSKLNPFFGPPLTGEQVQLLKVDSIATQGAPGFADLGVATLETLESIAPSYLWRHRPYGQFQTRSHEETSRVDA